MKSFSEHCQPPSKFLACGYKECCSSNICNNGTSNSCRRDDSTSSSATVNFTYYDSNCQEAYDDHEWGACPIAVLSLPFNLIGPSNGCCKNETLRCTNCSQTDSNQSYLLDGATRAEVPSTTIFPPPSIESPVGSLSVSGKATDTPGGLDSGSAQATAISTSLLPIATTASKPVPPTYKPATKTNTAAVAGGIAGGIIGLALLLAVLAICYRRRPTRPLKLMDQRKLPTWGSGQARAIGADGGELEEIKQGPSPSNCTLFPRPSVKLIKLSSNFTLASTLTLAFTSTTRLHTLQNARQ